MKHCNQTHLPAQVAFVAPQGKYRLRGCMEQYVIHALLIDQAQSVQLGRYCKDNMEVLYR